MNNVLDFGAKGDGITKDTAAIQSAIDAGGMVLLPPGTYLSGTLYLKSNGGLFLEPGAVLLASPDKEDYNAPDFCPQNGYWIPELSFGAHFIIAVEQENITITGGGKIDGNRRAYFGTDDKLEDEWAFEEFGPLRPGHMPEDFWRPSQMLFICECNNVRVQNVHLFDAPYWSCFLHGCEDVICSGLRIETDQRTPNGDGIDIDCCRRVTVSDCIIDTGDDCITLRGASTRLKNKKACEYITVTNCVLHTTRCNAIRIAVGNDVIRHAAFSNIVFHHTRTAICIMPQYGLGNKGVKIHDITFSNLQMDCVVPFAIETTPYGIRPEEGETIDHIFINQVRGCARTSSIIQGSRPEYVKNVHFKDIYLRMVDGGEHRVLPWPHDKPVGEFAEKSTQSAFFVQNVESVFFDDVKVVWETENPIWEYGIIIEDTKNITLNNADFGKPTYSSKGN